MKFILIVLWAILKFKSIEFLFFFISTTNALKLQICLAKPFPFVIPNVRSKFYFDMRKKNFAKKILRNDPNDSLNSFCFVSNKPSQISEIIMERQMPTFAER